MLASKEAANKKVLGRGLAALIPSQTTSGSASQASGLRTLPIDRIRPNKRQPRKVFDKNALEELSASVKVHGVLQPIVVRRIGDDYEIIAGERRWRAAGLAGLKEIPAVIKELNESEVLQVGLIENLQRQDLDPIEEADGYQRLIQEHGLTHDEVAIAVSKNRATISNSLRLLKLPAEVLAYLSEGKISAGHARALMTLNDNAQILKTAQAIVDRGLSVRDIEHLTRTTKEKPKTGTAAKGKKGAAVEEADIESRLQRALGAKVRLHHRKGKGQIEIFFHSFEELDGLLEKLSA